MGRNFLRKFNFELVQTVKSINAVESFDTIINRLKTDYSEVFDNKLGEYKFGTVSLDIAKDAKPIFCKHRPVPFAWKATIEKLIKDLVKFDVLEPVNNAVWSTPLVPIVQPDGTLRICGDYKTTVNRFLVDFKYPSPRKEEIFASLEGSTIFSKLDLSNAYNQLTLDENSQKLCTWSTHIGTFKMKRMPYGVKPAAAIFQKKIENLLKDIPNVTNYIDEIIVGGETVKEHVEILGRVLQKLKSAGLKLNLRKCTFFKEKVSYLGFDIDKEGLKTNSSRIEAVLDAPIPNDISEVRAFVGMVNHYSKFIPDFANKMYPIYELLRKDAKFKWSKQCQEAYEIMRGGIRFSVGTF